MQLKLSGLPVATVVECQHLSTVSPCLLPNKALSLQTNDTKLHDHQCLDTNGVVYIASTKSLFRTNRSSLKSTRVLQHPRQHGKCCTLQAWQWQKALVAASHSSDTAAPDTVLLLQHPAVYTLGAGSTTDHLHFDPESPPYPLHRTERGGEVTYHGPGQLVLYPIMNLKQHTPDMHWYLRSLEEVVIR